MKFSNLEEGLCSTIAEHDLPEKSETVRGRAIDTLVGKQAWTLYGPALLKQSYRDGGSLPKR